LDFNAMNVCNVLWGRSTSTTQNLKWIYPKVFNYKFNSKVSLLKLAFKYLMIQL